jgi:hypothetical protein
VFVAIVFLFLAYLRWRYLKRKQRKRKLAEEQRQQHLPSVHKQETRVQPLSSSDTIETPTSAPQSFSVDNPLREPKETQKQQQQHQQQTVANPLRATKEAQLKQQQRLEPHKQLPEPAATALPPLPRPQHHWVTKFSTRMDAFYYVNSLTGVSTWVRPEEVKSVF